MTYTTVEAYNAAVSEHFWTGFFVVLFVYLFVKISDDHTKRKNRRNRQY